MNNVANKETIMVHEIYLSIQGETSHSGVPCVFVRTQGCSLRCSWCDTVYALDFKNRHMGKWLAKPYTLYQVLEEVKRLGVQTVEVTGGEPLDQPAAPALLEALCEEGYTVLLETAGHKPIEHLDHRVHVIMDMKCPSSGMSKHMRLQNILHLKKKDEVKFVVECREDYEWAKKMIDEYQIAQRANVLFSPSFNKIDSKRMISWLLQDKLKARFQLQIHKHIWDVEKKGV